MSPTRLGYKMQLHPYNDYKETNNMALIQQSKGLYPQNRKKLFPRRNRRPHRGRNDRQRVQHMVQYGAAGRREHHNNRQPCEHTRRFGIAHALRKICHRNRRRRIDRTQCYHTRRQDLRRCTCRHGCRRSRSRRRRRRGHRSCRLGCSEQNSHRCR